MGLVILRFILYRIKEVCGDRDACLSAVLYLFICEAIAGFSFCVAMDFRLNV